MKKLLRWSLIGLAQIGVIVGAIFIWDQMKSDGEGLAFLDGPMVAAASLLGGDVPPVIIVSGKDLVNLEEKTEEGVYDWLPVSKIRQRLYSFYRTSTIYRADSVSLWYRSPAAKSGQHWNIDIVLGTIDDVAAVSSVIAYHGDPHNFYTIPIELLEPEITVAPGGSRIVATIRDRDVDVLQHARQLRVSFFRPQMEGLEEDQVVFPLNVARTKVGTKLAVKDLKQVLIDDGRKCCSEPLVEPFSVIWKTGMRACLQSGSTIEDCHQELENPSPAQLQEWEDMVTYLSNREDEEKAERARQEARQREQNNELARQAAARIENDRLVEANRVEEQRRQIRYTQAVNNFEIPESDCYLPRIPSIYQGTSYTPAQFEALYDQLDEFANCNSRLEDEFQSAIKQLVERELDGTVMLSADGQSFETPMINATVLARLNNIIRRRNSEQETIRRQYIGAAAALESTIEYWKRN